VIHATIDPITHAVTLTCSPTTRFVLTVTTSGNGSGGVVSSPAGIACGSIEGSACSATYDVGTVVTLTAPQHSSRFAGWTGACTAGGACLVTMNSALTVDAASVAIVTVHVNVHEPAFNALNCGVAPIVCPAFGNYGVQIAVNGRPDCLIPGNAVRMGSAGGDVTCDYTFDTGTTRILLDALTTNALVVTNDSGFFPITVPAIAVFTDWAGCDAVDNLETTGGTGAECILGGPMTADRWRQRPARFHPRQRGC
jgi:hypothetical protein